MKPTHPLLSLAAAGLIAAHTTAGALSGDEEAACGALLCLAGGAGVSACAPYLERYFAIKASSAKRRVEKRRDFLDQCPASDLPGEVKALIARDGAACQPGRLVSQLNGRIEACERTRALTGDDCRPSGHEWRICAAFYASGYSAYQPPRLTEDCPHDTDDDPFTGARCTYEWIAP